jgi:hypothetical protein
VSSVFLFVSYAHMPLHMNTHLLAFCSTEILKFLSVPTDLLLQMLRRLLSLLKFISLEIKL